MDLRSPLCSHPGVALFHPCAHCGRLVLPNAHPNYFELFELKPGYFVNVEDIQNRFYKISRALHPDRHANRPHDFEAATQWFAVLNKAWMTLKFPAERAEYIFSIAGFQSQAKATLPPSLAEEYFDLQDEPSVKKWRDFSQKIQAERETSDRERDGAFQEWERAGASLNSSAFPFFEKAARALRQRSYLDSMANDLKRKMEQA